MLDHIDRPYQVCRDGAEKHAHETQTPAIYRIKLKTLNLLIKFNKSIASIHQYEPYILSFLYRHDQKF